MSGMPQTSNRSRQGNVLVIDDDALVSAMVRRILERHHFVVTASSASQAMQYILDGANFDVIVCDLGMPEMNGMELFDWLQQVSPHHSERMLFFTGGARDDESAEFIEKMYECMVSKPCEPEVLRQRVFERVNQSFMTGDKKLADGHA